MSGETEGGAAAPEIQLRESGTKGRYVARFADAPGAEAEMTFSRAGEHLIIIDHTFAPDALRGRGAARALVARAVADARAKGGKILPLCPVARALFEKSPDWADVLHR